MAGGLLNLIALGNQNIILTGNPTKSFFKSTYSKYTNFGLQKFRIDQVGQTELDVNKISKFSFKIMRYGDLLMDMYLVVKLPKIWSPILKYSYNDEDTIPIDEYRPYEFKWIKNIGCQIIKEVNITIDGTTIQKFSGHYLQNIVERDFDANKKAIFDKMTGNINELNDPANYYNRNNNYPNAFNSYNISSDISGIEPSIRDYNLYIPINSWFSMSSLMALPLICLQYSELVIDFTLRPITELYTIKDVLYNNSTNPIPYNNFPQIQANQNEFVYQFKRFIHPPPIGITTYNSNNLNNLNNTDDYVNLKNTINSNIHLICTQCFLEETERKHFAKNSQSYLIREINEYNFEKVIKSSKIKIESKGLISSWMWYFQRSDVASRNEWSNYTNWLYEDKIPNDLKKLTITENYIDVTKYYSPPFSYSGVVGGLDTVDKYIYITGESPDVYSQTNQCEIMKNFAIICDGKYREQDFDSNIFSKLEKYNKSNGSSSKIGLYCYNFSLTTDPFKLQPNGAFNTNLFKTIEFEYNNYSNPPIDSINSNFTTICDPITRAVIGVSRDPTSIYKYTYNLYVIEEKYNILLFQNGFAGLVYSK
jgi:hypothetical protein